MKQFLKRWWWLLLVLLTLPAILFYNEYNRKPADLLDKEPDLIVTAEKLIADYAANEEAANKKYLGKTLQVTGITASGGTAYSLLLEGGQESRVSCTLDSLHAHKNPATLSGEKRTLKGICTGFLMDVELTHCVIIP